MNDLDKKEREKRQNPKWKSAPAWEYRYNFETGECERIPVMPGVPWKGPKYEFNPYTGNYDFISGSPHEL